MCVLYVCISFPQISAAEEPFLVRFNSSFFFYFWVLFSCNYITLKCNVSALEKIVYGTAGEMTKGIFRESLEENSQKIQLPVAAWLTKIRM